MSKHAGLEVDYERLSGDLWAQVQASDWVVTSTVLEDLQEVEAEEQIFAPVHEVQALRQ